ncbi:serine/arginine repetitive matrix protein 1-like [Chaetodon trifascialis]|uniref:serine/arginine repetitive matrix protein 1-like n=1 Tax=Chaetodon trifascialis TaxID=109706 RepID=UPI00399201BC
MKNGELRVAEGGGVIRSRWSSLHRFTLERLVPARRSRSREELRATESEARPLTLPRGGQSRPFLPRYESTGSSCLCPQAAELRKKGLNQSAPSVFSPAPCNDGSSAGGCSDDYAYPPPPVPAYSFPNSPALYRKGATGGHSRNIPTPGRTPSWTEMNPLKAQTAPSSPASRRSTRPQGVSTLPTPSRQQQRQTGCHDKRQEEPPCPLMIHYSTAPHHNGCQNLPKRTQGRLHKRPQCPELSKQRSMDELRSTVQTAANSFEHGTQDVRHLGQKMRAATGMITDSVEENAQALNLLAEVVDKLQGLIVASNHPEPSPPRRPKHHTPPPPPPRVSSISPKVVCKPPTPYPCHLSSSSSSCSSSSSSTSVSSCADAVATSLSPTRMNGGSKRTAVSFGATHRRSGCTDQVRLNNGSVSRAPLEDRQDGNSTGCLATKKKKKK